MIHDEACGTRSWLQLKLRRQIGYEYRNADAVANRWAEDNLTRARSLDSKWIELPDPPPRQFSATGADLMRSGVGSAQHIVRDLRVSHLKHHRTLVAAVRGPGRGSGSVLVLTTL